MESIVFSKVKRHSAQWPAMARQIISHAKTMRGIKKAKFGGDVLKNFPKLGITETELGVKFLGNGFVELHPEKR